MSIGARIKEERQRLGLSQPAFASLAGVAKSTQVSWEGDASAPTAPALAAMAEAGADVLYVVTGQQAAAALRQGVEVSGLDLEAELEQLEAKAAKVTLSKDFDAEMHAALTRIATSPFAADALQTRADNILRRRFNDPAAAERRQARIQATIAAKERYAHDLLHLVADMSLDIDPKVERELTVLMYERGIEAEDIIPLLDAMRKADAVVWPIGGNREG